MTWPRLTSDQLAAATSNYQLCYVEAGPGSGKTFLATEAFGYLRFHRYADDARGVIGVTFARSARSELAARVRIRWGRNALGWPNGVLTFDELHRRVLRHLIANGLIKWPGGEFPRRPEDSWARHPNSTPSPGKKDRSYVTLDDEGDVVMRKTIDDRSAPKPCFTDGAALWAALEDGACTHADVRNILRAAIDRTKYPKFYETIRSCLAGSICHLVVDECFDMNPLDIAVVRCAVDAGVSVTIVGDPWQSLYEFRGARPDLVKQFVSTLPFKPVRIPGTHRYDTAEMRSLAQQLFDSKPFQLSAPTGDETFDVVLAQDWATLWEDHGYPVVPGGLPGRFDGSREASALVLLLNEVVARRFGHEIVGVSQARRALEKGGELPSLDHADRAMIDPFTSDAEVWAILEELFPPVGRKKWKQPGATATRALTRMREVLTCGSRPILGLSSHQAKGLEWNRVLLIDPYLVAHPSYTNELEQTAESHRSTYVALTRARSMIRLHQIPVPNRSNKTPVKLTLMP